MAEDEQMVIGRRAQSFSTFFPDTVNVERENYDGPLDKLYLQEALLAEAKAERQHYSVPRDGKLIKPKGKFILTWQKILDQTPRSIPFYTQLKSHGRKRFLLSRWLAKLGCRCGAQVTLDARRWKQEREGEVIGARIDGNGMEEEEEAWRKESNAKEPPMPPTPLREPTFYVISGNFCAQRLEEACNQQQARARAVFRSVLPSAYKQRMIRTIYRNNRWHDNSPNDRVRLMLADLVLHRAVMPRMEIRRHTAQECKESPVLLSVELQD
ncbi:hypothetical protein WN51_01235 [Melipona quadrifasciata]|uniref:Uncharacterized protein n=1 Tax=Melipona quadrifasciata TaxID=166423 RepID=A0A0N0BFS1_9HYME|nr:hypothetical protein WN51_01235 [Melipona quadrifasciata]